MRTVFREQLDAFAHDLIVMCDTVGTLMDKASSALLNGSLNDAEHALSLEAEFEEIRVRSEDRAVQLLLLESPVASDLRQVISSIYIVSDFERMGALAMHVAQTARRRHPEVAIPESMVGYFTELARLVREMAEKTRDVLVDTDADVALVLADDDDAVDDLHEHLLNILTQRQWQDSTREAVDVTLLARYYERYADHCVNVAARIVYLSTGMNPDEYIEKKERDVADADVQRRFEALERQFSRRSGS